MHRVLALSAALVVASCTAASGPSQTASPGASATPTASATVAASREPGGTPTAPPAATPVPPIAWTQLSTGSGPSPREDHTWTVDAEDNVAYLFGGRDGRTVHADLWAYDLASDTWRTVEPDGDRPPARFGHEAVWVDGHGLVVFAGQVSATGFYNDLWAYDAGSNRWARLPGGGDVPVPRYGTCAALGPDGRLWISHGFTEDGTRFADTRAYDFAAASWSDETPAGRVPVARCLHGCWWTDDGRFALYAGQTTGIEALDDLWVLAGPGTTSAAWERAEIERPPDRNLYAFARHGEAVVVVGGRGIGPVYRDDGFLFDAASLAVSPLAAEGASPPGRAGATLVDDPARGRMLLFGGRTADAALADTWAIAVP